ncbi:hypothetical protein [Photobacterium leiognathi]|uniref:hypothetical protein n=1 Tax=Photobacterium leiognathi TaxID=553611 RepID=UPI002982A4CE|nr:hypothetical protein [Photobacterium leiognathi]
MGWFSDKLNSINSTNYNEENVLYELGTVVRVTLSGGGNRYGIFAGRNRIIFSQGGRVKESTFDGFLKGESFFNGGWFMVGVFEHCEYGTVFDCCAKALNMIGESTNYGTKEFVLFCRTGDANYKNISFNKGHPLYALSPLITKSITNRALKKRHEIRKNILTGLITVFRQRLSEQLVLELEELLPPKHFILDNDDREGVTVSLNTQTQSSYTSLIMSLAVMNPLNESLKRCNFYYGIGQSTFFEDIDEVVSEIINQADLKYKQTGIYCNSIYIANNDDFLVKVVESYFNVK